MAEQRDQIQDLRDTLGKMAGQFGAVLPSEKHVQRFIRVVMTAAQQNQKLVTADRTSFYSSCMKCAQEGLMPDGREAVLKIYNTKKGNEWVDAVQYEPMTEGLLKKLRLSGEVLGAPNIQVVHENDEFDYQLGDEPKIMHRPARGERGEIVAAYSIIKLADGETSREVMWRSELNDIMERTKSRDYKTKEITGPWKTDFSEMCRKTVFKRHYKRLPRSTDLDNIINEDNEQNGIITDTLERARSAPVKPVSIAASRPVALAAVAAAGGVAAPAMPVEQQEQEYIPAEQQESAKTETAPPLDII